MLPATLLVTLQTNVTLQMNVVLQMSSVTLQMNVTRRPLISVVNPSVMLARLCIDDARPVFPTPPPGPAAAWLPGAAPHAMPAPAVVADAEERATGPVLLSSMDRWDGLRTQRCEPA